MSTTTNINCPECGRPCATIQGLGKHRSSAHGVAGIRKGTNGIKKNGEPMEPMALRPPDAGGPFKCDICENESATKFGLKMHMVTKHKAPAPEVSGLPTEQAVKRKYNKRGQFPPAGMAFPNYCPDCGHPLVPHAQIMTAMEARKHEQS